MWVYNKNLSGKESTCQAGDARDVRLIPQEDSLEKEIATHSSILAWKIPWTEVPVRLQSIGWQRVGQDLATKPQQQQQNSKIKFEQTLSFSLLFFMSQIRKILS